MNDEGLHGIRDFYQEPLKDSLSFIPLALG